VIDVNGTDTTPLLYRTS